MSEKSIMSNITGITRGGTAWEPAFITALNQTTCIGCGRCYKVCPRNVFELVERSDVLEDEDMDEDDDNMMVMAIVDAMDCIGCQSCARVCPKNCHTHEPQGLAA
ncbi:ferredoxin III, nif-specific [Beggiatoa leptomitoformis]|uniref:Ferredoxin III n=2 Tax=Beggiatoa leptomitoformis TaxID=288004 RepID=A0A2N9YJ20_9GAMM|nr:ferredoxin III, nif-specific [Beggiatoa leptomitoformis]AUI70507.1 ferredoxin III, nif-specific [Beggiatoa leptomitoformis]